MHLYILPQGGSAEVTLVTGSVIKLSTEEKYREIGDANCIFVDYKNIVKVLGAGDLIYIDDGLLSLKVTEKGANHLIAGEGGREGRRGEGGRVSEGGREGGREEGLGREGGSVREGGREEGSVSEVVSV